MAASFLLALSWFCAWFSFVRISAGVPAEPQWFEEQLVDHFSTSSPIWRQRYYASDVHFGGPGHPIFLIVGGEGGIPPDVGIFYPWVADVLAMTFKALVVELEHRFYGESLPFGNQSFSTEHLVLMNSEQAIADIARFVHAQQRLRKCSPRGFAGYCPVLTIGGSYPGFLSAMMRLRFPSIVDMAYAASAPLKFYSQQVGQYEYYSKITKSAERSLPGCAAAVRAAMEVFQNLCSRASAKEIVERLSVCPQAVGTPAELADNLLFLVEQTFANLNMANYPPNNYTSLYRTCSSFVAASTKDDNAKLDAIRVLLLTETQRSRKRFAAGRSVILREGHAPGQEPSSGCFDMRAHLPGGPNATTRCGDWSGCGVGRDGEMWDYQTCTWEVECIGFGTVGQMFPERPWSLSWLEDHCERRFGVRPDPFKLSSLWGFDEAGLEAQASRIVFTNGLNDGWSVGGILRDLVPERGLLAINLPNGAHHSDLSHSFGDEDTPDVKAAHEKILQIIEAWLHEIHSTPPSRWPTEEPFVI